MLPQSDALRIDNLLRLVVVVERDVNSGGYTTDDERHAPPDQVEAQQGAGRRRALQRVGRVRCKAGGTRQLTELVAERGEEN